MSSDITLQKQKEVWRGRDQIIEIKVIGEGPGRSFSLLFCSLDPFLMSGNASLNWGVATKGACRVH